MRTNYAEATNPADKWFPITPKEEFEYPYVERGEYIGRRSSFSSKQRISRKNKSKQQRNSRKANR